MKKTFKEYLEGKKITQEEFNKKSAGDQAGLFNEYNAEINTAIDEAIASKASKEDIQSLKDELSESLKNQLKSLNGILEAQGVVLKKMRTEAPAEKVKGLAEILKEKKEGLTKVKHSNSPADNVKFTLEGKAVGDMSIAGNVTGQVPQAMRLDGMGEIASRRVRLLDIVSRGAIDSNLVEWVYQANKEGAAGQTAEGATKNQIDFDILVGSQKVEKSTAYITVTDEMIDDISFMRTAIEGELTRELLKVIESGVYSGSGVSPAMNGIRTVATAFAAGTFALAIDNANEVDVLTVAMNQIDIAEQGPANYILMHPSDVTSLKMVKVTATDKRYVERLALVAGQLSLDGMPIIPTTLVTQGEYLVGDFSKAFVLEKQGISIEIGYNSDNFVKNYKTIRIEWRGVTFVQNNDRTSFVKGVFATDKAALETV